MCWIQVLRQMARNFGVVAERGQALHELEYARTQSVVPIDDAGRLIGPPIRLPDSRLPGFSQREDLAPDGDDAIVKGAAFGHESTRETMTAFRHVMHRCHDRSLPDSVPSPNGDLLH